MSISLEPNKGLRVALGRLSPICTWQGGGNFWSHEFQLTVRSGALAGFLPRAIEDEDSVLFEHRTGGVEAASTSLPIQSMSDIPAKELSALRAAVDELKRKAQDPHCDRTKRQMIEGFRLPDPQKDRDLYRLIGKGSSAKLIVLWGLEREEGSALSPGAAVDLMHTPSAVSNDAVAEPKKSMLVPALILLALLGGGGWFYWQQEEKKRIAALAEESAAAEQKRIAAFNAAAVPAQTGETPSAAATEGAVILEDDGTLAGVMDKDGTLISAEPGTSVDPSGKTTSPTKPGDVIKDDKGNVTGVVDAAGKVTSATPGKTVDAEPGKTVTAPAGTVVRDGKGAVSGVVGKDGKVVPATPGTTADKDGKITASKPGTVFRDDKGHVTGIASKDGKVVASKAGAVVSKRSIASKTTAEPTPKPATDTTAKTATSSTASKATGATPGTVVKNSSGAVTGLVDKDGKVVPAKSGTQLGRDGKVSSPAPGTVLRDRTGSCTGVCGADGKVVAATPGKVVEDKDGKLVTGTPGTLVKNGFGTVTGIYGADGKLVSASPGTVLDREGRIVTSNPGTVFRDSSGVVTGIAGGDGKIIGAEPGAVLEDDSIKPALFGKSDAASPSVASPATAVPAAAPASVTTPMTTQGPPPVGISSLSVVSTSLSGVLGNGNVEVLLNVVARDVAGAVVNAPPITGWKVNGQLQSKPDGTPSDGPVIPVSLPPGTHRISTVGKGADGQPFQTDADVLVSPKGN